MSRIRRMLGRLVPVLVLVVIAGGLGYLVFGRSTPAPEYTIELDNAFGLTNGAEFRAAGVRVGHVMSMKVDPKTAHALVKVAVERTDFGDLRQDATCTIEPQSLIGEYFMDCEPGHGKKLPAGGTIPVKQTTGTIPPDLVLSVMRLPQREQLGFILTELGAGFAARGPELNEIIQRAVPALRDTDSVLKILADNRQTLQSLSVDADTVLTRLAGNRRNVARFVREARDTATISAGRRAELADTIRRLPGFLAELRPTLRDLGTVADKQTPALRDLRASAGDLTTLLDRLGPFAKAAQEPISALGQASVLGTKAAGPAGRTIDKAATLGQTAKDPATNLRFILEHIDDRNFAVEKSPVSPGGRGFTGLEALLRYPFVQSQALNLFDSRGYTLKLNALVNECTGYTNAQTAKNDPGRTARCNAWLGPNQPGITTPDPSPGSAPQAAAASRSTSRKTSTKRSRRPGGGSSQSRGAPQPTAPQQRPPAPSTAAPATPAVPQAPSVQDLINDLVGTLGASKSRPAPQPAPAPSTSDKSATGLLDYLLGQ